MFRKPLHWVAADLAIGEGKSHALVHVVSGDSILSSKLIPLASEFKAITADKKQKLSSIESALRSMSVSDDIDLISKKLKDRGY
jgi:hypothetical protein